MKKAMFKKLLHSIDEIKDIHSGKKKASREIVVDPDEIKRIRKKLHASQSEFAHMIGVSSGTLKNWEQGRTYPVGAARALLKVAAKRPDVIREALSA